jgi:hypothetical protein
MWKEVAEPEMTMTMTDDNGDTLLTLVTCLNKYGYWRISGHKRRMCSNILFASLCFSCTSACRSQWPRDLRWGSAADRLLVLRVRIPLGAWMSVSCYECCQVERSLRQANHSSREVLPTVVCHCVWSRSLKNEEAVARFWLLLQTKKNVHRCLFIAI